MSGPSLYLLDTNILVHYVRGSAVWRHVRDTYAPLTATPTPLFCVVSEGELRSLAVQWKWAERKLDQMEFALSCFQPQTIERPNVMRTYAILDAYCESIGQPMGKNDLWIAATAAYAGATLLTTDRDFDRLAPRFLSRICGSTPTPADSPHTTDSGSRSRLLAHADTAENSCPSRSASISTAGRSLA